MISLPSIVVSNGFVLLQEPDLLVIACISCYDFAVSMSILGIHLFLSLPTSVAVNHILYDEGVLAAESVRLLQDFFATRR
jgi:hypothetical protein